MRRTNAAAPRNVSAPRRILDALGKHVALFEKARSISESNDSYVSFISLTSNCVPSIVRRSVAKHFYVSNGARKNSSVSVRRPLNGSVSS